MIPKAPCLPPRPRTLAIHGATMATPPSLSRNRSDPAGRHGYGLLWKGLGAAARRRLIVFRPVIGEELIIIDQYDDLIVQHTGC